MERECISLRSALKRADAELGEKSDECERLRDELRSKGAARLDHIRRGSNSNRHRGASTSSSPSSGDSDGDEYAARVRHGRDSDPRAERLERENRELVLRLQGAAEENVSLKKFLKDYGMTWVGDERGRVVPRPSAERKVRSTRLEQRAAAARAKSTSPEPSVSAEVEKSIDAPAAADLEPLPAVKPRAPEPKPRAPEPKPRAPEPKPRANVRAKPVTAKFKVNVEKLVKSIKELNGVAGDGKGVVVTQPNGDRVLVMPTPKTLYLYADGFRVDDGPFRSFDDDKNVSFVRDVQDGYFPYEMVHTHPDGVPFRLVDRHDEDWESGFVAFTGAARLLDSQRFRPPAPVSFANIQTEPSDDVDDSEDEDCEVEDDTEVTTLRVKAMNGLKTYVIRLGFDDTVGDLRRRLGRVSGEDEDDVHVGKEFEIRGGYPPRAFTEDEVTLREAGLVPNAALLLKPVSTER